MYAYPQDLRIVGTRLAWRHGVTSGLCLCEPCTASAAGLLQTASHSIQASNHVLKVLCGPAVICTQPCMRGEKPPCNAGSPSGSKADQQTQFMFWQAQFLKALPCVWQF